MTVKFSDSAIAENCQDFKKEYKYFTSKSDGNNF